MGNCAASCGALAARLTIRHELHHNHKFDKKKRSGLSILMLLDPGYDNAPTREIDQAIAWLEDQAYDCQAKIAALQSLKRQRAAQAKYRANLKALVSDIAHKDFINYSAKDQIEAIRQRTGADYDRAKKMVPLVKRLANNEKRRNNRVKIAYLHEAGFSAARIAEKIGQSRQNVHLILKSLQSDPVF